MRKVLISILCFAVLAMLYACGNAGSASLGTAQTNPEITANEAIK